MPVKRRKSKERKFQITNEAVALFVRANELKDSAQNWEEDGGSREEYLTTWRRLHRELGLYLWQASPLDVHEGTATGGSTCWSISVPHVLALRAELLRAAGTG